MFVPVHAKEAYRSQGIAPLFF